TRRSSDLEANAGPLLLDDLSNLAVRSGGGVQDDLERGPHGACLLEQGFRFVWIVLQAAALQEPRVARRVGLVEHVALTVIHRLVDRLAINGVRCGGAQELVLKRPTTPVEGYKDAAQMPAPDVVFVAGGLLEALEVSVGHGIDKLHLASAQGGQTYGVFALGLADDLVEVGQAVALGIGLPVVLETHQPGLIKARPRDELERPCADGVLGGLIKVVR